jgi:hypothetical protein
MLNFIERAAQQPKDPFKPPVPPRDMVLDALKKAGTDLAKIQGLKHE